MTEQPATLSSSQTLLEDVPEYEALDLTPERFDHMAGDDAHEFWEIEYFS